MEKLHGKICRHIFQGDSEKLFWAMNILVTNLFLWRERGNLLFCGGWEIIGENFKFIGWKTERKINVLKSINLFKF